MKKREIWISIAIITGAVVLLFLSLQRKGQIKIDAGGAVTTLQLGSGWFGTTTITSEGQPCKLRACPYSPELLRISMQQDGNTWRLESRGPWGELSEILVKNNNTTVLKLGPPFQIKPKTRFTGTKVSIDFLIIGQAGERYRNIIMKKGKRIPAPKVRIIDEAGDVLAFGKFEYG